MALAARDIEIARLARQFRSTRDAKPVAEIGIDELVLVVGQAVTGRALDAVDRDRHRIALGRIDVEPHAIGPQEWRRLAAQADHDVARAQMCGSHPASATSTAAPVPSADRRRARSPA